jgi:hypothetical protein
MSVQLPVQLASSYRPATASYPPSSPASSYMCRSRPDGGQAGRLVAVLETCSRPRGSAAGSVCVATAHGLPWCVGRCQNPRDCTAAPYPLTPLRKETSLTVSRCSRLSGTRRDMPMAFVPSCPGPKLRSRNMSGHLSKVESGALSVRGALAAMTDNQTS